MKTVIYDLGGVIFDWQPARIFREFFDSTEELDAFFRETDWYTHNARADAGTWSASIPPLQKQFPQYAEAIAAYVPRYLDCMPGHIEGSMELLHELHAQKTPLFCITNWASDTFAVTRKAYPFLDEIFRDIIVSGDEGLIKPDPRIYETALTRFDVKASDAIFIDDALKNVDSAKGVGIDAIHFTDVPALRAALGERGII